MENENQPQVQPQVQPQPVYTNPQPQANILPAKYKPISAWGYVGYQLLFAIPLVGLIFLLVFALGGTNNENLKNFSRSFLCWFLIMLVIGIIVGIIFILMIFLAGGMAASTGA